MLTLREAEQRHIERLKEKTDAPEPRMVKLLSEQSGPHAEITETLGRGVERLGWSRGNYACHAGELSLVFHGGDISEPLCDLSGPECDYGRILWLMGAPKPSEAAKLLERHIGGIQPLGSDPGDYVVRLKTGEVVTEAEMLTLWRERY